MSWGARATAAAGVGVAWLGASPGAIAIPTAKPSQIICFLTMDKFFSLQSLSIGRIAPLVPPSRWPLATKIHPIIKLFNKNATVAAVPPRLKKVN